MSIQERTPVAGPEAPPFELEAELFKALGDPHRLTILAMLARAQTQVCVCHLTAALPLNQPAVSHHLKVLKDAGLVTAERRGTWVHYALAPGTAERLAGALRAVLVERGACAAC
jgi:ArsR family transcriptional regulator